MENELKPCPFCGRIPEINSCNGFDKEVICHLGKGGCGARIGWYCSLVELKKAWNKRTKLKIQKDL